MKRQHPGVSSANVTATTLSDDSMDAALEEAIGRANVMLAELQADQEQQDRARPARLSATPVPPPSAATFAAAAASASSKKRSHSSMETVSPLVQSSASSSTTPNMQPVVPSSLDVSALGATGAEEELEQLTASSVSPRQMEGAATGGSGAQQLQQQQQQHSMPLHFPVLPDSASVTPATEGQGELVSRLLKRSRSESQSPASVLTSKLTLQQVGALSPSLMMMMERPASRAAGSFSPIPSPVLFSASTPLSSALYASRSAHLTPTAAGGVLSQGHSSGFPHPWLAHVPMPPTLQQLHSLSASSSASSYHHSHSMVHAWSTATSPSHAHLPPLPAPAMHASAAAVSLPVSASVAPLSALNPIMASANATPTSPTHSFNTSASSAFSFKNTPNAH